MSQSRLALLIGKSPTTIRAWEHGRTNPADPQSVAALAAVLGLDETELLGEAGFEAPVARTRPSARQALTSLATERTEMIALAPPVEAHQRSKPIKPAVPEPDLVQLLVVPAQIDIAPEVEIDMKQDIMSPAPIPIPPPDVAKPKRDILKPKVTTPKARIVVTQQMASSGHLGGSNGFVDGRSYLEDEAEKDFYRRRGATTAIVLVFMVIVIWWALGRTGGAIADLIESIVGALDI